MKNITLAGIFFLLFSITNMLTAQTVKGILTDENDKTPLSGATIKLINRPDSLHPDSTIAYTTVSNKEGAFIFENVLPKYYRFAVSSVGIGGFQMTINVKDSVINDLGIIAISKR